VLTCATIHFVLNLLYSMRGSRQIACIHENCDDETYAHAGHYKPEKPRPSGQRLLHKPSDAGEGNRSYLETKASSRDDFTSQGGVLTLQDLYPVPLTQIGKG